MNFPNIRKDAHRKEAGECCHRIEDVEGEHLMNWKYWMRVTAFDTDGQKW